MEEIDVFAFQILFSFLTFLFFLIIRGNNLGKDDAEDLKYALLRMPHLRQLDLSDNPLTDAGLRSLSLSHIFS